MGPENTGNARKHVCTIRVEAEGWMEVSVPPTSRSVLARIVDMCP